MQITSIEPKPPITEWHKEEPHPGEVREELGGQSIWHWCPNTNLHKPHRMHRVRRFQRLPWWGQREHEMQPDWYCNLCGLREYYNWAEGMS